MPDIALVNQEGQVVGAKPPSAIAADDIFHSVFIVLVTPARQLILSQVGKKLSATAVTMCQAGETPAEAAARAAQSASARAINLHHLGDQFYTAPDGRKSYMSVFYGQSEMCDPKNCRLITRDELTDSIATCTPAFVFAITNYRHLLPI